MFIRMSLSQKKTKRRKKRCFYSVENESYFLNNFHRLFFRSFRGAVSIGT